MIQARFLLPLGLLTAAPVLPQQPHFDAPARQAVAPSQHGGQLDASETIFAVLAAINAAGYDAEADSPMNHPLRKAVRDYLKAQDLPVVDELRGFVRAHRQKDAGAELSQYISYALVVNGPPDFAPRYNSSIVPPDVDALYGFTPLMVRFYQDAHIAELWKKAQSAYDQAIAQYQAPVARAVLESNAYLRNDTAGYLGRRFQIYLALLAAPNQVQERSYVDDFFVVVTPAPQPHIDQIRHGYLVYLLDPLAIKYADTVMTKRGLGDYALGSPILNDQYKSDFTLLTTQCLIKAVESRLDRKPAEVEQALREGFVLTPAIDEQLDGFEKQEQSMRLYFPALIEGIDLKREEQRLDHIDFTTERSDVKVRTVTREVAPAELTGAAKTLAEAEKAYLERDLARAHDTYLDVLKQTDEKSMHAKAYYGLARIALLERDPQKADELFRVVLEQNPDAATRAWSLLYLGRLADSQGWRDQAVEHYKAALAVPGAPDTVRQESQKGLKQAFVKK